MNKIQKLTVYYERHNYLTRCQGTCNTLLLKINNHSYNENQCHTDIKIEKRIINEPFILPLKYK